MTGSPEVRRPRPAGVPRSYDALGELVHEVGRITISTSRGPVVCMDEASYARLTRVPGARRETPWTAAGGSASRGGAGNDLRVAPAPPVHLTARENDLLRAVAAGQTAASAAAARGLAVNTVAQHLASIRRKYRVRTTVDAVLAARADGQLLEPPTNENP